MTCNAPVSIEFETKDFPFVSLPDALKTRLSQSAKKPQSKEDIQKKLVEANARALTALLAKKAKVAESLKRVQVALSAVDAKRASLIARSEEEHAKTALRRLALKKAKLESLNAYNAKVARVSLHMLQDRILAREARVQAMEERLEKAIARQEQVLRDKSEKSGASIKKARMLAELKRSKAEKKMENLNLRLENAHVRRLNLLLSRRPSTAAEDANSGLNVTIPSPTKLEFETTEFHTTPLPPHVKARFESSLASPKKAATKDETQRRMLAANARALSNLLKRKEKAKRVIRRAQSALTTLHLRRSSLLAQTAEAAASAALRRIQLRESRLTRLEARNARVAQIAAAKAEESERIRMVSEKRLEDKLAKAVERQEVILSGKAATAGLSVTKARALLHEKQSKLEHKKEALAERLEGAERRRQVKIAEKKARAERTAERLKTLVAAAVREALADYVLVAGPGGPVAGNGVASGGEAAAIGGGVQ